MTFPFKCLRNTSRNFLFPKRTSHKINLITLFRDNLIGEKAEKFYIENSIKVASGPRELVPVNGSLKRRKVKFQEDPSSRSPFKILGRP